MFDVVSIGELLIDFAPVSVDDMGYPTMAAKAGGAPPNFLATLSKYGVSTAIMCKVGKDAFGELLIKTLNEAGVNTSCAIIDDSVFTTLAFVSIDSSGDRSFSFSRKPGADTCLRFEELDLSLIDNAKYFHFGTLSLTNEPSKDATKKAVAYAKSLGKTITFDPNLRPPLWDSLDNAKEQILWGLAQADIVKISDNEVEFLWDCNEQEGAKKLLRDFNVKLAMVTSGDKGALLMNKNATVTAKCPPVNPVDTTGGGDIFGGAAICQILRLGKSPEDLNQDDLNTIIKFALAAGSLSTQTPGGLPSIPDEADVQRVASSM